MATAATNWRTNPRGWFLDPQIDVQTTNGLARFHDRLLEWEDRSIVILRDMGAQGMITWDMEGVQFPPPITYVGDPTLCSELAPEMAIVADEYFAHFRRTGLRVGVTVRPQQFRRTLSNAKQEDVSNPADQLIRKIGYARQRWGATLFYIDSNGYPGWPLGSDVIAKVAGTFPDVLLIPEERGSQAALGSPDALNAGPPRSALPAFTEEKNISYYAVTAPYSELRKGAYSTPSLVRFFYPEAFSIVNTADGFIDARYSELVAAADRGDILMFRSLFPDPANDIVKRIYRQSKFKGR